MSETLTAAPALKPVARPVTSPWPWIVPLGILGIGMLIPDPILSRSLIDVIVNNETKYFGITTSALIVTGLFLVSLGIPIGLGRTVTASEDLRSANKTHQILWVCWGAVGLAMALMRYFEEFITSGTWTLFNPWQHLPIALLMAGLFFGGGLELFHTSKAYFTSTWHRVQPAVKKAEKATKAAYESKGLAFQGLRALEANRNEYDREATALKAHLAYLRNTEALVKEAVRVRIATEIGDVRDTSEPMNEPHQGLPDIDDPVGFQQSRLH